MLVTICMVMMDKLYDLFDLRLMFHGQWAYYINIQARYMNESLNFARSWRVLRVLVNDAGSLHTFYKVSIL